MANGPAKSLEYAILKLETKDKHFTNATLYRSFLGDVNFTEKFDDFVDALDGNTSVQSLELGCNGLTGAEFKRIAHALRDNTELDTLDLSQNNLGDEGMVALAELIGHLPKLARLHIGENNITNVGLETLRQVIEGHPSLMVINAQKNHNTSDAVVTFTETVSGLPRLCGLSLDTKGGWDGETIARMNAPMEALQSKNLSYMIPNTPPVQQRSGANGMKGRMLFAALESAKPIPTLTLFQIPDRLPILNTIAHLDSGDDEPTPDIDKLYAEKLDALPQLAPNAPLTLELLLTPDEKGYTPLDNPRNWEVRPELFETVNAWLAQKPDLIAKRTPQGLTLLDYTLVAAPDCAAQIAALNESGLQLQRDFLLENGELTPVAAWLADEDKLGAIFTIENWLGTSVRDFRTTVCTLPEPAQAQIPNYYRLLSELSPKNRENAR